MAVKTEGFNDLINDLLRMQARVSDKGADRALKEGARPILEEMQSQASVDPRIRSGNLFRSIKIGKVRERTRRRKGASGNTAAKSITIGTHKREAGAYAPHAHLVEFGHGGPFPAPEHPFIRPAFDRRNGEAFEIIRRVLQQEIDRQGR